MTWKITRVWKRNIKPILHKGVFVRLWTEVKWLGATKVINTEVNKWIPYSCGNRCDYLSCYGFISRAALHSARCVRLR
jgi:hypothetical protein